MARSRRFDPEVVAEAKDQAEINIDEDYIHKPGTNATLREQISSGFFKKPRITKVLIDRAANMTAITEKSADMFERSRTPFGDQSSFIQLKHD